jgi:CO dehydrogenase maturation factor
MEAGLEHLGRGTTDFVDRFIVVIEPGARSIQTYKKVKQLAADIGVTKISVVANKIRGEADREFLESRIPKSELLGFINYNEDIISADRKACSPYEMGGTAINDIRKIKNQIDSESERNG